jgi:predicted glycoside hydrolase/deacetylase ChbG (UPF0249 family)
MSQAPEALLIVTADDYGYSPLYNRGILRAAREGALDAVGAMVGRGWCDPAPLLATGVEVGLHLEWDGAGDAEGALRVQLELFERLFGGRAAYLDGHHHCHAGGAMEQVVAAAAARAGLPVRSVDERHRLFLRERGVATPDRLVGRVEPGERALPAELEALPPGVTEWMVHPGEPDPQAGSAYDAARAEDLELLLSGAPVRGEGGGEVRRASHRAALAGGGG